MSARRKAHLGLITFAVILIASMACLIVGGFRQSTASDEMRQSADPFPAAVTNSRDNTPAK